MHHNVDTKKTIVPFTDFSDIGDAALARQDAVACGDVAPQIETRFAPALECEFRWRCPRLAE
eukprot:3197904-Pyramimonas_sp.AAC.1